MLKPVLEEFLTRFRWDDKIGNLRCTKCNVFLLGLSLRIHTHNHSTTGCRWISDNIVIGSAQPTGITTGDNGVLIGHNAGTSMTTTNNGIVCIGRVPHMDTLRFHHIQDRPSKKRHAYSDTVTEQDFRLNPKRALTIIHILVYNKGLPPELCDIIMFTLRVSESIPSNTGFAE